MLTIVLIVVGYWILLSLLAYFNVKKIFHYFNNLPNIQIKEEWKGFMRDDRGKWDQRKIIIGCFTRFPYNLTVLGFFLISFIVLIPLSKFLGKKGSEWVVKFEKLYANFAIRQAWNIVEQQDYRNYQIQTPLIICNHVNWFDIWYLGITFMPLSIVSKASIKKTPIVGTIADFFKTIYVDRESQGQRDSVVEKITSRIEEFNNQKIDKTVTEKTNPLIIFPEGTTSNGKSIITFKMGAFNDLSPLTLFALNYKCKQFHLGMGDISQSQHVFLNLCLRPTLEVKHKVMRPVNGETPEDYCKRCRTEMSKLTGFPQVESRFRDYLQYEKAINQAIKQRDSSSQKGTKRQ